MTAGQQRKILHVDMDAFYASVEQRDRPELRGRPVVVGGDVRGVVAAASYEARKFGIRSAMPMSEAKRRCPVLIRVPLRMDWYRSVSDQVFDLFREFTPVVEGLSLDEAFLDVTESLSLFGTGELIAESVKARIRQETGLTASVGVAPNKLVAKIASELEKPDGLVVVTADNLRATLDPLPVQVIPGIGPETSRRLHRLGIHTVEQLRTAPERVLEPVFGRFTGRTLARAAGIDDRPVVASRAEKSMSAEMTFASNLTERADLQRELMRLSERTAGRLRAASMVAGNVQLKIRQGDFSTFTRQRALKPPGNNTDRIFATARQLLDAWLAECPGRAVRLLGVGGSELSPVSQPDLFDDGQSGRDSSRIDRAVDQIRGRFGSGAVGRARVLGPRQVQ